MLGVEQEQHHCIRARGAEGGRIGTVGCDPQAFKLEDCIETNDTARQCDENQHRPRHALVYVLEQDVKGHCQEDKECPIQQVGDDAQTNKPGVCDNVPSRSCRVAGNVHPGIDKSFGKAAENADEQVEDAGDSREALR